MSGQKNVRLLGRKVRQCRGWHFSTKKAVSEIVEKWVAENDKDLDTSLWLKYVKDGRDTIGLLKCAACLQFETRLVRMLVVRSLMEHLICVLRIF